MIINPKPDPIDSFKSDPLRLQALQKQETEKTRRLAIWVMGLVVLSILQIVHALIVA
jgi:hypothetical protein